MVEALRCLRGPYRHLRARGRRAPRRDDALVVSPPRPAATGRAMAIPSFGMRHPQVPAAVGLDPCAERRYATKALTTPLNIAAATRALRRQPRSVPASAVCAVLTKQRRSDLAIPQARHPQGAPQECRRRSTVRRPTPPASEPPGDGIRGGPSIPACTVSTAIAEARDSLASRQWQGPASGPPASADRSPADGRNRASGGLQRALGGTRARRRPCSAPPRPASDPTRTWLLSATRTKLALRAAVQRTAQCNCGSVAGAGVRVSGAAPGLPRELEAGVILPELCGCGSSRRRGALALSDRSRLGDRRLEASRVPYSTEGDIRSAPDLRREARRDDSVRGDTHARGVCAGGGGSDRDWCWNPACGRAWPYDLDRDSVRGRAGVAGGRW